MKKPRIISFGEVLWDLFPDGGRFGGAPANFACHAALQGAEVTICTAVGDDRYGDDAIRILSDYDIDVSLVQTVATASTGTASVNLDDEGKPSFLFQENSAWDKLQWTDDIATKILSADAICFGTLGQRSEMARQTTQRALEVAGRAKIPRVVDINLRPPFFDAKIIRESIQLASILKMSDEEVETVCAVFEIDLRQGLEAALRCLMELGQLKMIVVTRGSEGALLLTTDEINVQAGIPTEVIDTVGAGDAFTAAFLIRELQGSARSQNLLESCMVAAEVCSHAGAVPKKFQ
ncbi:MAG: carbohydrate kinase [Planctomycetota bacterium]|nr:carbohydrate kinase [Planctomycetota bacterium]MEC8431679.1 carbohydrate kinase [Planctomycetota bacterium]MEC9117045.1 carbohydrate kinase [Planctomycetota bacterium]